MMTDQKLKKATYHLWTFFFSKFATSFGAQVYAFTVSFYILQTTGSATSFALNLLCNIIPRTAVTPVAGYITDRFDRKKIVITAHLAMIVSILLLICAISLFGVTLPLLYVATAIFSITSTFSGLAFTSSIASLVNAERIQKAMSLNQMVISLAAIASPVIGGMLFGFVSMEMLLVVFLVAVILALLLESTMDFHLFKPLQETTAESAPKMTMWKNMKEGLQYTRYNKVIMTLILMAVFINLLFGALQVGASYILIEQLDFASEHFGLVEGALAVGMLLMSIILSTSKELKTPVLKAKHGSFVIGFLLLIYTVPLQLAFSYRLQIIFYAILMFSLGVTLIFINTPIQVYMQKEIEDKYKGRVFSILEMGSQALMPLGTILYGFLYDLLPATIIMSSSGFIMIALIAYLARPSILRKAHPA